MMMMAVQQMAYAPTLQAPKVQQLSIQMGVESMCMPAHTAPAPVADRPGTPVDESKRRQKSSCTGAGGSSESSCPPLGRAGVGPETGDKIFDPLSFSTMGGDKTLAFFRHAEIKHGRVAMAAVVGLLFHINHIHFPGYLSPTYGVSFAELSEMGPFDAWNAVPLLGQIQVSGSEKTDRGR